MAKGNRPKSLKELHIRVRSGSAGGSWQWALITADGHVANVSETFLSRQQCEADAKRQDLPVVGLARAREKTQLRRRDATVWEVSRDQASGLWSWTRLTARGELLQRSPCMFLTKAECMSDARKSDWNVAVRQQSPSRQGSTRNGEGRQDVA